MRERAIEFKVGLLIAFSLIVLVGFVFILGNFTLSSGYTLYVDYSFTGNLQPGAPVKVSGIKVGKVEAVEFWGGKVDEARQRRVQVRLKVWVEDRVRDTIRSNAEFFINTAGVLGEQYLEIVPGDDYDNPPIPENAVLEGVNPPRTDLIVSRLYEVLDSFSSLLRDDRDLIRNMLKNTAEAVSEANILLKDNRQNIGNLVVSADGFAKEATVSLKKVNDGLGDPRIISRTLHSADALLVNANGAVKDLTPPARAFIDDATRVTGLISNERVDRVIKVADNAVSLTGKTGRLVDNVDGLVKDMRAGKGTAGALLARDEVYADLREMIRDLKRNPWKFFWKE